MNTTLDYRCPNCNGSLQFRSDTQQLTCPYCDSELSVEGVKEYNQAISQAEESRCDWETYQAETGSGAWSNQESANLVTHICQSCNGEIVAEKTTAVTACPYCDNNLFIPYQFADELRPDYVIPFKLNKEQAKGALRQFYNGKPLLNPCFKRENHLDEIKGVYVPFWLFDCDTQSDVQYKATRVRAYSDSRYNYVETKHYSIHRGGRINFDKIPGDGSSKMNDTFMEAMEPYNYRDLVPFTPAYFAGYLADKYDVLADSLQERVNQRIRTTVIDSLSPKGYQSVTPVKTNIRASNNKVNYALFPVWILNTRYRGELHTFMVNGQTGKLVGKLPVDPGRCAGMFFGIFLGISLFSSLMLYFL